MIGQVQLSLIIMGAHWGIDNDRLFNYLSDFAEDWLKDVYMCLQGVYMCQNDTCEISSHSDHSFNSYDEKSKCSIYVFLSLDEATIHFTWVLSLHLYR